MKTYLSTIITGIAVVFSLTRPVYAQYVGATCGYSYGSDLTGPNDTTENTPLYNPPSGTATDTWGTWLEQAQQAGLDFLCPNLRGSQPNTSVSPVNIAPLVTLINNRGLANTIKIGAFDDNAGSWQWQWNMAKGTANVAFDIGDSNNWVYIYDYNYKIFFQTVPDANRFKINGRPVIIIWTGNPATVGNEQGNYSRAMTYVRQRCQTDFGFDPYIIVNKDALQNDTTLAAVIDAAHGWSGGGTWTLLNTNNVKIGVAFPGLFLPSDPNFRDPNHGVTLETALNSTVGAGALLTLCEGFTDAAEDAAFFRVRNIATNGTALSYSQTLYDFPNQRLQILRKHSQNPFFGNLKFEAEGCDTFGGANGGNGKVNYYRNGNIAIETTTDINGGHDVGWMQTGEWLEWTNVPANGSPHFLVRIATPTAGRTAHLVIDGVAQATQTLPSTGGGQTWTTYDFGTYGTYSSSYHTIRIVFDNGGVNFNWWLLSSGPPSAPTGLTATSGNNVVVLSWMPSSGAASYNVKRATVSGGPYTTIASPTTTSYTDATAVNGTTYYYVVSAVNILGESANASQVSATPQALPPVTPTGVTATPGNNQVALSWTASAGATSYNVKRATVNGGPYTTVASPTTTSYTDATAVNGTTYYYVVSAVNALGESANSTQVSATPTDVLNRVSWVASASVNSGNAVRGIDGDITTRWDTGGPQAPGQLFQVNMGSAQTFSKITLDQGSSANDYPIGYQVNVSSDGVNWGSPVATGAGTPTVTTITFATQTAQYIRVTQTGSVGNYWSIHEFNAYAPTGSLPAAPTGLTATAGNAVVNLSWVQSTGSGITQNKVYRSTTGSGGPYNLLATLVATTSYSDTAVVNGSTYFYSVSAVNANGESALSAYSGATPQPPPPAVPTGLAATAASSSQINLGWTASSGATSYNIKRATVSGGPYTTVATGVTGTTYNNTGLTASTTYYYVVSAVNGGGESANSAQASATTQAPAPPAAPTGLAATAGNAQVSLSWTASSGATSYNVKRATVSGGPYTTIASPTTTSYMDTTAVNGTTYYYVVSAVNANGESANSTEVSATPSAPTVPAAPTGLTATVPNGRGGRINLSWTASNGATSYNVKRATVSGGPYTTVASGVTTTAYNNSGLTSGTTYYYVVSAVNAVGESPNSTQASATAK
jgi:fibronectin type 3 domain-containing protein